MAFADKKGINIASPFKLQAEELLDVRQKVDTIAERDELVRIHAAAPGLRVFVKANKTTYIYNGSGWDALISSANIGSQSVTTATKLSSSAGSATQPVYFSGGKPVACSYTLGKSVPSNAVFTDTTYSDMKGATSTGVGIHGLVPAPSAGSANRYLRSDGTWQVPPDTNTTYTLGSFGITASAAEINYTKGVTSSIQTQLNGKASSGHTHNYAGSSKSGGSAYSADVSYSTAFISGNEIRFAKPSWDSKSGVWIGYRWSDGTLSDLIEQYNFANGAGGLTKVAASTFIGSLTGNADTASTASVANVASALGRDGNSSLPMTFRWEGKDGQPSRLWGSIDGSNMYTYDPSNFKVAYANTTGGVVDYKNSDRIIKLSFSDVGLNTATLASFVGYDSSGNLNWTSVDTVKSKLGLSNYASASHSHHIATTSAAGFLPKLNGSTSNYLRGDGSWATPPNTNTDTKVTQTAVAVADYTNWRSIPWGSSNSASEEFTPTTVTDVTYTTPNLSFQPSTGTLKATVFKGSLSGNATSASSANYATSAGSASSATTATKLSSSAGSATQPIYFSGGKPVACSYTLGKSVPSNAVFTDTNTWIAFKGATASAAGTAGYAPAPSAGAANRYLRSDGTWSVPPDTNTTYSLGSFGITASATEINYTKGVTSSIQSQLNGKAASNHNHSSVNDSNSHAPITFAYSKSGLDYSDYSWLAGWNGTELRTVSKSQFATAGHEHTYIITPGDQRSTATKPSDYSSKIKFAGLKNNNTIGVNSSTKYSYVMGFSGWNDHSGGPATEFAFDNGTMRYRLETGSDGTSWGSWGTMITSANIGSQSVNYANSAGSASSATTATKASGVVDYNDISRTIKVGYQGSSLDASAFKYFAGYNSSGNIKNTSVDVVKSVLGLSKYASASHSHSTASTSSAGFMPKLNGSTSNYLRGDGAWATPPNTNTDTKVTNTPANTSTAYITGTTSSSTNTGTQIFDTGVYLTSTSGRMHTGSLEIGGAILTYDSTNKSLTISFS